MLVLLYHCQVGGTQRTKNRDNRAWDGFWDYHTSHYPRETINYCGRTFMSISHIRGRDFQRQMFAKKICWISLKYFMVIDWGYFLKFAQNNFYLVSNEYLAS